jgi:hypothetical protein
MIQNGWKLAFANRFQPEKGTVWFNFEKDVVFCARGWGVGVGGCAKEAWHEWRGEWFKRCGIKRVAVRWDSNFEDVVRRFERLEELYIIQDQRPKIAVPTTTTGASEARRNFYCWRRPRWCIKVKGVVTAWRRERTAREQEPEVGVTEQLTYLKADPADLKDFPWFYSPHPGLLLSNYEGNSLTRNAYESMSRKMEEKLRTDIRDKEVSIPVMKIGVLVLENQVEGLLREREEYWGKNDAYKLWLGSCATPMP